jgi:K+-sensing histidine kinase KdpD
MRDRLASGEQPRAQDYVAMRLSPGMLGATHSPAMRYGAAVAATALALGLALSLHPLMQGMVEGSPVSVLLAAVAFSAWYGGLGPGIVATLLSASAGGYFYAPAMPVRDAAGQVFLQQLLVFTLVALLISTLSGHLRAAHLRAEAANERVRRLQAVTDAALAHLALDDLLRELLGRIHDVLSVDTATILLAEGDELVVRAACGLEEAFSPDDRVPIDAWIPGRVAAECQPIAIEDVEMADLVSSALREHGVRSLLGAPLFAEGRAVGVVLVGDVRRRRFTEDEVELLRLVADRVASAIERARLNESQERAEQAQRFLAEASKRLAGSLDYDVTLQNVARLAVPTLADWCMVDVLEEGAAIRRVAVAHIDPATEELARSLWRRHPPDDPPPGPLARVLRTGVTEIIPDLPHEHAVDSGGDPEHLAVLRQLGVRALVVIPVLAHGRTLGAIWLGADRRRCCSPARVALAEELAHRCALAIDNARLYHAAQEALRAREEFLAATSHELRTPLTHIKGFVSTLRQTDVKWNEETRRHFLAEAEREADRLGKLIGDLLDMSRIEGGGLDSSERAPTALAALVASGLDRVRGLVGERVLTVDMPAELPLVKVDAEQLERVIANLVENAAKYSPPDSTIWIVAGLVDGGIELSVEDDGPGIPPDQLEHVFEKFFRGQRAEQSGIAGTGLGLAICRGIVRAHGGRIWAENRPQGGARFSVRLPLAASVPPDLEGQLQT